VNRFFEILIKSTLVAFSLFAGFALADVSELIALYPKVLNPRHSEMRELYKNKRD